MENWRDYLDQYEQGEINKQEYLDKLRDFKKRKIIQETKQKLKKIKGGRWKNHSLFRKMD